MLQVSLVAFTTPDGDFHIHKDYASIHDLSIENIENIEDSYRKNLIKTVTEQMTNAIVLANPTKGSRQSSSKIVPIKKRKSPRRRFSL